MVFTEQQTKKLSAKLSPKHVRTRAAEGRTLAYIEGWHAIAEANRIFGFDGWDRETLTEKCVWSAKTAHQFACAYMVKVRITVRAGETFIRREGSGSGEAKAPTPGQAHENALKAAETDATKRALATFGNPFGLALYDKEYAGVRGGSDGVTNGAVRKEPTQVWALRSRSGETIQEFGVGAGFAEALKKQMRAAPNIGHLFDLWSQNLESIVRLGEDSANGAGGNDKDLIALLKDLARDLVTNCDVMERYVHEGERLHGGQCNAKANGIDKSELAIAEPKRIRCKAHLEFVAKQPCLICGRRPTQAHHVRYAQPRALGAKVSDEFTVPLCTTHHDAVHRAGDEKMWWGERSVDPLAAAAKIWAERAK